MDEQPESRSGYCPTCRTKKTFQAPMQVTPEGVKKATGQCPDCGTTITRILGLARPTFAGQ